MRRLDARREGNRGSGRYSFGAASRTGQMLHRPESRGATGILSQEHAKSTTRERGSAQSRPARSARTAQSRWAHLVNSARVRRLVDQLYAGAAYECVGGGGERQTPEWYVENGVELKLSTTVTNVDFAAKRVTTNAGESIGYETLVLATGCGVIRLPAAMGGELPGVRYVRDNADGLALAAAMETAKKAAVIGGGYIGLEVAASCATRGLKPEVIMMEPHVMARLWSPEIAAHYENLYESKGTTFHKNAKVKAINKGPDGAVESVELEGGVSIPADLVIVGVGAGAVTAPFDALEGTLERFPGGTKVDGTFAASGAGVEPKSVYAIGDIAAFPLAFDGNQIVRMEHVAHARASATHAAECILADSETPYAYTPYFYSRVFEQVSFYFDLRMGD